MKSLEHKAFFWKEFDKNENPINPRECQIVFNPKDGGKLIYFLDVNEEFDYENFERNNIKVLYGQVLGGKKFTFNNLKYSRAFSGLIGNLDKTEVTCSVEYIFYGEWIKFDNLIEVMHIRYSYLELWFDQVKIKRPINNEEVILAGIMVQKESLEGDTSQYDVVFNIDNKLNQTSFNNKVITYQSKNLLAISKKEKFKINQAIELSLIVKSFFELMTFYSDNKIFIEEMDFTIKNGESVELLFKQDDYVEEQKMSYLDFLLRYQNIKDNFIKVLNIWIEIHDKNKNEYSAFCNVISDKNTKFNIYTHYFQLISALEGYYNNNFKEDIEFRKKLNQLIVKSEIKKLLPLNSSMHQSISNTIYTMRNDLAHSKKVIEINNRVKSSFEYIKIVALLLMMKDISLNHTQISKHIFDYDLSLIEKDLESAFSKN